MTELTRARPQVNNNTASDVHPMVDRDVFKDERKSSAAQLKALNHSVCRAVLTFLNPFAVSLATRAIAAVN